MMRRVMSEHEKNPRSLDGLLLREPDKAATKLVLI